MPRTLEEIEQDIRANNLRGPLAIQPRVYAEHSNPLEAFERLERIDQELAVAIAAEDTARVRRLNAEKSRIVAAQERETAQRLALINASRIPAPAPGEEARLAKRSKQLGDRIARGESRRKKLLDRLANDPENENLLGRIDLLKSQLAEAESEQRATEGRLEQIAQWCEEKRKAEELAAEQAAWERNLPKVQAQLRAAAEQAVAHYRALSETLRMIDGLRLQLRAPNDPASERRESLAVFQKISDSTNGLLVFDGGQWSVCVEKGKRS